MSKEIEELMQQVLGNGKAARRGLHNMASRTPRSKAEEEAAIEEAEATMVDGEQLTLDIEEAMDTESTANADENESPEVTEESAESQDTTIEENVEFEEPSADDDIHEDY